MSIVAYYRRDEWEAGDRFDQVESYVTDVFVMDEPANPDLPYDHTEWEVSLGPPPAMCYEHYRQRERSAGGGWELEDRGDTCYDPDHLEHWHGHVQGIVQSAVTGVASSVPLIPGDVCCCWTDSYGLRCFRLVQPNVHHPDVPALQYRQIRQQRLDAATQALARIGFAQVGGAYARRALFVYAPTAEERMRALIETGVAEAIGDMDADHLDEQWTLVWRDPGADRVSVHLFGRERLAAVRVEATMAQLGYRMEGLWAGCMSDGIAGPFALIGLEQHMTLHALIHDKPTDFR